LLPEGAAAEPFARAGETVAVPALIASPPRRIHERPI
jgi:hypothetical protein